MKWLLTVLFFAGLAAGVWWALPPRAPVTAASTVSWELANLGELGELRLLTTEIASYQTVTTLDPKRYLKAVIPVRVVLGMDLTKATVRREGEVAVVTLPTVRFLRKSSDPRRWNIWESHGELLLPGETLSLAQLAELQAGKEAEDECLRLGLFVAARTRAEAIASGWLRGFGAGRVVFAKP
jgi:hypothetical protein